MFECIAYASPGRFPATVVAPGCQGLQGKNAGDVDKDHPRLWKQQLEHRVEADDAEKVEPVIPTHLLNVRKLL